MNYKKKKFGVMYSTAEEAKAIKAIAESLGWIYVEKFVEFTDNEIRRRQYFYFTTEGGFLHDENIKPAFSLTGSVIYEKVKVDSSLENLIKLLTLEPAELSDEEYFTLVGEKLRSLRGFYPILLKGQYNKEEMELCKDGYANDHFFIASGKIQEKLLGIAFYRGTRSCVLSLRLYVRKTWKDVYNILKDIESL